MTTLREVIVLQQQRAQRLRSGIAPRNQGVDNPWWDGYYQGQHRAYQDLMEILEQRGFDLDVELLEKGAETDNKEPRNPQVVLVERDYKGEYERYALTQLQFASEFKTYIQDGMPMPSNDGQTWTIQPMVHVWYKLCEVDSGAWHTFFTDMEDGLPESDIACNNLASVRFNLMPDGWLKVAVFKELAFAGQQIDFL